MKHLFFALALMLSCMNMAFAQSEEEAVANDPLETIYMRKSIQEGAFKQLYYGVRFGATLSSLGDFGANTTSNKVGLLAGGFIGMDINTNWAWQAGLNYVKKGGKIDSEEVTLGLDPISGAPLTANYNYLSIPIQARYFPTTKHGLFIQGGASANLLLQSEIIGIGGDFEASEGRIDVKDQLNGLDFALQGGIGYEWTQMLEVSLLYQYGIGNTLANNEQDLRVNNQGLQISLGFRF